MRGYNIISLEKLTKYDLLLVFHYLNATDLMSIKQVNKQFYYREIHIINIAFKRLCFLRWNENDDKLLKILGTENWSDAYNIMVWKERIPKGIYTSSHKNIVFGHGKLNGCEGWILIAHTSNTKLRWTNSPNVPPYINIRLCLQNIDHDLLLLQLNTLNIIAKGANAFNGRFLVKNIRIIAKNGQSISDGDENSSMMMRQYEFIVLSMEIQIVNNLLAVMASTPAHIHIPYNNHDDSDSMEHETDFLAMTKYLVIQNLYTLNSAKYDHHHINGSHNISSATTQDLSKRHVKKDNVSLECRFIDEEESWNHYIELPGNVILLRHECKYQ